MPPAFTSITVVTAHFGDDFWIRQLVERVEKFSNGAIEKILVINQNRDGSRLNLKSQLKVEEIEFEPNLTEIERLGHDHPNALNQAMRLMSGSQSSIIVMDSDCPPADDRWLESIGDMKQPVLASDPKAPGLTHPCFMFLPPGVASKLDFSQGQLTLGFDTGRLVGLQCEQQGFSPIVLPANSSNWGKGTLYAGGSIYHHGSGSMLSSSDKRLNRQVVRSQELHIRKRLVSGSYSGTAGDLLFRLLALLAHGARALKR